MIELTTFATPAAEVQAAGYITEKHLTTPQKCAEFLRSVWANISYRESMYCVYLNQSLTPTHYALISVGGIDQTPCDLRIVMKHAIDCMATGIILAHNHPSGKMEPSQPDKRLTDKLRTACEILNIRLLDHIILSGQTQAFYSMAENCEV